jgi:cell shape-determining protein MreC
LTSPTAPTPTLPPYAYSRTPEQAYNPPAFTRTAPLPARANNSRLAEQQRRTNEVYLELARVREERDQLRAELSAWAALRINPEQVKALQDLMAKLQAENRFLVHQNSDLEVKLSRYVGPEKEVKMPVELSGRVLNVDSKYGFVVLNIGGNQGVAKDGKLLVSRDGRLVAKVRVTSVNPNSSIADVVSEWKLASVLEGDRVLHQ